MSPRTGLESVASTRSTRLAASSDAVARKRPGIPNAIVRPCTPAGLAIAALMIPWGVDQNWNCRSLSAIGAATAFSPITFQA